MADHDFDLFVIGAGSGGVRAARVAAVHGARVAVAEGHRVGGTCVIRGCVPKKMLVYGARFAEDLRDAPRLGWAVGAPSFDWAVLRDHVLAEVTRLEGLYRQTLEGHKVTLFDQRATLVAPHEVELADGRRISARRILIAVGGWPVKPAIPGADYGITSNEVFHLPTLPRHIVIAGGGYIANEFAGIFHELGCKVTLVNRSETILRGYDPQIRDRLIQIGTSKGIQFRFNAHFQRIDRSGDGQLTVHLEGQDPISADTVLFATGRKPATSGLGLETLGLALDEAGGIKVDDHQQTSVPSIYAVGDVTNRIQLTPMAIREGQAFADTVFGNRPTRVDYEQVPMAVFANPPIAAVGLTEAQARERCGTVRIYTSDFRPMKSALVGRSERALYKMVVDDASGRVLGLHMIGPDAPEILQAAAVAVKAGLTKADFDATVALHPSMAEELVLMK